jgi:hypothetical protein
MGVRDAIRDLPASRIAEISALGMEDPAVIPLWYRRRRSTDPRFHRRGGDGGAQGGWRLGWMTVPPDLLPVMEKLVEFNTSGRLARQSTACARCSIEAALAGSARLRRMG